MIYTAIKSIIILAAPMILVDSTIYQKFTFAPWNLIKYNVLQGNSELYGTEPSYYYILNLFLNFNIVAILALLVIPLLFINAYINKLVNVDENYWLGVQSLPVYIWFFIFSFQAHKEERFMYPIYPLLCFNAAVATHAIENTLSTIFLQRKSKKIRVFWIDYLEFCIFYICFFCTFDNVCLHHSFNPSNHWSISIL